jgi:hypothetical protein
MDSKIKILILAANPWKTNRLSLDEEQRNIQQLWDKYDPNRTRFDIRYYPAVRGVELQEQLLNFKPHLLHFTGHGENEGIILTDASGDNSYEISKQTLAELFKSCAPDLKAVFLNACYSANQADEIVEQVEYVVGMNAAINDLAAIYFSQGFYTAIFTQETLDIEKAFKAGCNQMAVAKTPESEQKKPVLQKRRQTFVPAHQYDIAISSAEADREWAQNFTEYLHKQLKQKLATADGFQIYSGSDIEQLQASAMLLFVVSPDYLVEHENQLEQLKNLVKQKTDIFLLETDSYKLPEGLKGLSRHRFWVDDEDQGIVALQGEAYIDKANQVAELVAKKLQDLKTQHQHQQRIEQERQQQQKTRAKATKSIDAFVFLHSAPEDLDLTSQIVPVLEENGVDYVLPLERSPDVSATEIRQDIENNILNCDAVLVLYEQTSPVWVREQLGACRRLQRKRETPLKVIAVYKSKEKPDLNYQLDNLHVYVCPPQQIESYLQEFIEALA